MEWMHSQYQEREGKIPPLSIAEWIEEMNKVWKQSEEMLRWWEARGGFESGDDVKRVKKDIGKGLAYSVSNRGEPRDFAPTVCAILEQYPDDHHGGHLVEIYSRMWHGGEDDSWTRTLLDYLRVAFEVLSRGEWDLTKVITEEDARARGIQPGRNQLLYAHVVETYFPTAEDIQRLHRALLKRMETEN